MQGEFLEKKGRLGASPEILNICDMERGKKKKKKSPTRRLISSQRGERKIRGVHSITEVKMRECFKAEVVVMLWRGQCKKRSEKLQWDLARRRLLVTIVSVAW